MLDPDPGQRLWFGGATPLGSLRGVRAAQAAWRPAQDRHSIWELTLHLAYWKYAVRRNLDGSPRGGFPRSPSNWPRQPEPPTEAAWREDRALFRAEHQAFIAAVRAFDPDRLDEPARGGTYSYAELLHGVIMHDTYHVGQIQLLKRLHGSLS
jgi:uncharacterized damage-inducible protein DinB